MLLMLTSKSFSLTAIVVIVDGFALLVNLWSKIVTILYQLLLEHFLLLFYVFVLCEASAYQSVLGLDFGIPIQPSTAISLHYRPK